MYEILIVYLAFNLMGLIVVWQNNYMNEHFDMRQASVIVKPEIMVSNYFEFFVASTMLAAFFLFNLAFK